MKNRHFEFICNRRSENDIHKTWVGTIDVYSYSADHVEAEVNGRGSKFVIVTGPYYSGHYVCIPDSYIGCMLGQYNDFGYNYERLSECFNNEVDPNTICKALTLIPEILDYLNSEDA